MHIKKTKNLVLILLIIMTLLTNCAPPKKIESTPVKSNFIFYPALPNKPRLQHLLSISTSKDIRKDRGALFKFVVGKDEEKGIPIKKAYGVAIHQGILFVCDTGSGSVAKLDFNTGSFSYLGLTVPGKMGRPINIRIDKNNHIIYVADNQVKQILCYTIDGSFLKAYGEINQFTPVDVEFDEKRLYVCDIQNHQIHVLDLQTGTPLFKIGKPGSGPGELFHPTNICIENDILYVSDTTNFRIQMFDLEGNFKGTLGQIGDSPGSFSRNKGIDADRDGNIYVVDAAFENVQIFNNDKKLLLYFLSSGTNIDSINLPTDILIDYDNMPYFKDYLSPNFQPEYLVFVTSQFGRNKVNIYAYGTYKKN